MSSSTFHTTSEDNRKAESNASHKNNGQVPALSEASQMKSVINNAENRSKAEIIEERRTNLPLPEDPPVASDWNSSDASKVNVGSGGVQSDISRGGGSDSLRGPATADDSARTDGTTFNKNTSEPNSSMGLS